MSRAQSSPESSPLFVTATLEGISILQCRPLLEAGVPHGFTLRDRSFGGLENGPRDGETLARALGVLRVAFMRQVHGNDLAVLESEAGEGPPPTCDAILTDRPGVGLTVQTADCVPILLWGSTSNTVAAIHAGWRGTLARITSRTIRALESRFGTVPGEIHAAIGPAIRVCCFEVGDEVVAAFEESGRDLDSNLSCRAAGAPSSRSRRGQPRAARGRGTLRDSHLRQWPL